MESMRLSRLMDGRRNCQIQTSVERARGIYGVTCADSCITTPIYKQEVPRESDILPAKTACLRFQGTTVGLESTRIQAKIQKVLEDSIDPLNPDARFSEYSGLRQAPVCPPVPTEVLNAHLPKASTRCPLPNKPSFPSTL